MSETKRLRQIMKRTFVGLLAFSSLVVGVASAQEAGLTYTPKPAAQPQTAPMQESQNCLPAKPFQAFVGEKVVFQTKTNRFKPYGYSFWRYANDKRVAAAVSYADLAGKVGTVLDIGPKQTTVIGGVAIGSAFQRVVVRMDADGRVVTSDVRDEHLNDVTLLSEIVEARSRWLGKTVWNRWERIRPSSDSEIMEETRVLKYQPVKVVAVVVGSETSGGSVDFAVQFSNGTEGLLGASVSETNVRPSLLETLHKLGRSGCDWDSRFFSEDPRSARNWTPVIWEAVSNGIVMVGMTKEQVEFAWGKPKSINVTETSGSYSAQWVFSQDRYAYFDESGRVKAIQN